MDLKKQRNLIKDFKKIEKFSSLVEKRLLTFDKDKQRIEKLSFEELQDLNELLRLADYILTKHEDKKEVYALLKDFVAMINNSSNSMDLLNDKITELVVSAEAAISRIKNLQTDVSENYSFKGTKESEIKASF
jgi:predicted amidohydrolase YtcJ